MNSSSQAKIKILPDTLISQIAAGEVIERPASAVKELLENSLDAGATFCSVEIEQGGMKLIAVKDNGCGMNAEDAQAAFKRHATSKISQIDDLSRISSYGFRGEALAAIASVSFVEMRTRSSSEESGTEIRYCGGKMESKNSAGCPVGTEIVVRNLFFNTPARKKFMKSETTELSHIVGNISHLALANPQVGFELKHNGKTLFNLPPNCKIQSRVSDTLGKDFFFRCIEVSFVTPSINIHGFIGEPGMPRSSKRHQYLFINGRDVTDPLVSRAVSDAYGSRLPARSWPAFVLNVDMDPAEVDVNVHPRKLSVKFSDSGRIYRDVSQAINQTLKKFESENLAFAKNPISAGKNGDENTTQAALDFSREMLMQEKREGALSNAEESGPIIVSQIADSYILALSEEGIEVIDQHAAHERILYEKLKRSSIDKKMQIQPLLAPLQINCSHDEAVFLDQALETLLELGFEFEKWSGNTFLVTACPIALASENMEKMFKSFLDSVTAEVSKKEILPEKILKTLACKAAVKFGMKLSPAEQKELISELQKTPNNATCPHGRPVKVLLSFAELERRFYR